MSNHSTALIRTGIAAMGHAAAPGASTDEPYENGDNDRAFSERLTRAVYRLPEERRLPAINGFVTWVGQQATHGDQRANRRCLSATAPVLAAFAMLEPCAPRIMEDVLALARASRANHATGEQLRQLRTHAVEAGGYSRDEPMVAMVTANPIGNRNPALLEQYEEITHCDFNTRDAQVAAAMFDAGQSGDEAKIAQIRQYVADMNKPVIPPERPKIEPAVVETARTKRGLGAFVQKLKERAKRSSERSASSAAGELLTRS